MTEPDAKKPASSRKISGLFFFGALLLAMIFTSYENTVPTIECNAEVLKTKPDVIMLGTSWCSFCKQARKYFHANKVSYCEYDIETSAEGERLYNRFGGGAIPVLLIDGKKYIGFDPVTFKRLMKDRQKT